MQHNVRVDLAIGTIRVGLDLVHVGGMQASRATLEVIASFVDRGADIRLIIAPDGIRSNRKPDAVLLKLLAHAFAAREALLPGKADPLTSGYSPLHQGRRARLSYLAPDIVAAIIEGQQPASISGRRLLRAADPPFDWQGQRALLGFP